MAQVEVNLASDYTAIRRASRMASPGDRIGVWRANECIFMSQDLGLLPDARSLERKYAGAHLLE